jgi:hypothetical protein
MQIARTTTPYAQQRRYAGAAGWNARAGAWPNGARPERKLARIRAALTLGCHPALPARSSEALYGRRSR